MKEFTTAHRFRYGRVNLAENSIELAIEAINNPDVHALETDIQLTKDGVFVLMNPMTIENMTELVDPSKNKIEDYTYDELCKMLFHTNLAEVEKAIATDAKEFGEDAKRYLEFYTEMKQNLHLFRIPTLEDVLRLPRKGKPLFVEIKTDYKKEEADKSRAFAKKLISVLQQYDLEGISIIGRDTFTLEKIKQEKQDIPCLPVVATYNGNDNEKLTYGFDGASIVFSHLEMDVPGTRKKGWEYLAESGKPFAVWNLRTKELYRSVKDTLTQRDIPNDFYPTGDFIEDIKKPRR